jgi:hypothetical protein
MFEYKGPALAEASGVVHLPALNEVLEEGSVYIELKIYKKKPKTLTAEVGQTLFSGYVSRFWSAYPKRNGKHLNKNKGQELLNKISKDEIDKVITGATNFARSQQARDGFAPDAFRWLQRRGWEEWQTGEEKERNRVTL